MELVVSHIFTLISISSPSIILLQLREVTLFLFVCLEHQIPTCLVLVSHTYPFSVVGDSFVEDWKPRIIRDDDSLAKFHT